MAVNKITIDGVTKINLLNTDIETAADIPAGKYGYLKTGVLVLGTGENMSNPLTGKILAVNGDSIAAGSGNNNVGYGEMIASANDMTLQNVAVGGASVATGTGAAHIISTSISDMRSDADYVILEGGFNDASYYQETLGSLTSGYTDALNTATFAGAFETMLKNALARFPGKKIGYIFVHKAHDSFDSRTTGSYYNIAKQACEKWGIPYLDLNTLVPPLGHIDALRTAYTSSGDGVHPSQAGYEVYYVPKITAWMKGL